MEDILASIRRIIADDQMHASRPVPAAPRRAPAERIGNDAQKSDRALDYVEVLDLARAPSAAAEAAPLQARAEPPSTARAVNGSAQDDTPHYEERDESGHAGSSKPAGHAQAAHGQGTGYAAPTLVRDYEQSGAGEAGPADLDEDSDDDHLVSPALGTTVMSAFETLAATVVLQNTDMLDRVMRELMRPLIKSWLDENLPTLVERLVRTEIERVARGGRG